AGSRRVSPRHDADAALWGEGLLAWLSLLLLLALHLMILRWRYSICKRQYRNGRDRSPASRPLLLRSRYLPRASSVCGMGRVGAQALLYVPRVACGRVKQYWSSPFFLSP